MKTKRSLSPLAIILPVALFALLPPSVAKAQFYGVQVDPFIYLDADPTLASQAISVHAQTLRFFIQWQEVEPTGGGAYTFSTTLDNEIASLIQAGVNLEVILGYNNTNYSSVCPNVYPSSGACTTAYVNYCKAVVNHFNSGSFAAGSIRYWEVWNEPDGNGYFSMPHTAYAPLLEAASLGIKSVQSNAQVLLGGLTGAGPGYLDALYADGVQGYFDIVNYHDYNCSTDNQATDITTRYNNFHSVMNYYSDGNKPIWVTEFGYVSENQPDYLCSGTPSVLNSDQATALTEAFNAYATIPNLQVAIWYSLRDYCDDGTTPCDIPNTSDSGQISGLFDRSGNVKPSATSFASLINGGNLLFNPTWASNDQTGWTTQVFTNGYVTDAYTQYNGGGGVYSFNGDPFYLVNWASHAYNLQEYQQFTGLTPGQGFTAQVWAYTQSNASGGIGVQDQGNGWASRCWTSIPSGTWGWNRYTCAGTVPASGDLQFNLVGNSSGTGDTGIYWDNASLTLSLLVNPTWTTDDKTGWTTQVNTGYSTDAYTEANGDSVYTPNGIYGDPFYLVNFDSGTYSLQDYQRLTGLTPGQGFTAQVYAYTQANASGGLGVQDQGDGWGNLCPYQNIPSGTGGWNLYSCTGTVPTDGDLQFNLVGGGSNSKIFWNNASLSFNVLSNPTWTTYDKTGWTEHATTGSINYAYAQATGGGGIYSEDGGPYYLANWSTSAYNIYEYQTFTGLTSGGSFTASVWAQSSPGATSQLLVQDGFGSTTLCSSSITPGTGAWNLYVCSGTVPSDDTLTFVLNGVSPAGSDWTEWDNASLTVN